MSNEKPPPRPVAPPGQVSSPDQLPTVEPGEWPAQPHRATPPPPPPPPAAPPSFPVPPPLPPTAPPPPTGPAPRSFLWWWVALAAVVVLGVGTATTLVVVRPWDGDTVDRARPEASELPATTPSAAPTTGMPTQLPPVVPVTGDLDGDGLGDAAAVFGHGGDVERWVLSSTGMSFEVGRERLSDFEDRTWADFDGDGTLDQVSWAYQLDGELTLTSPDIDFAEVSFALRLVKKWPYVTMKAGDFDGDGAVDLVAYGTTASSQVSIWMLHNNGQGFDAPVAWDRISNTTYPFVKVLAAELTGDDRADLVVRRPTGPGRYGFALLTSTGEAFSAGRPQRPSDFEGADLVVGDFSGNGTPVLLLVGASGRRGVGVRLEGLRMSGDRFVPDHRWDASFGGAPQVLDAVVSDVDGDRIDDVVYAAGPGATGLDDFRVLRSTGVGLEPSEVWARTPRCDASIDCVFYFQNSY